MAVYTVHVPSFGAQASGGEASQKALADAQFVREGFSRAAFFLGPLWLAWHRLWIALIVWFAVFFLLASVAPRYIAPGASVFIGFLLEVLLGLEGNNLRRLELARLGYRLIDVAAGRRPEDAERSFYRRRFGARDLAALPKRTSAPPPLPFAPAPGADVVGLFPTAENPQ